MIERGRNFGCNGTWFAALVPALLTVSGCEPLLQSAPATGGEWVPLGLEGQHITALSHTRHGLFAGTRFGGVYRLSPGSSSWTELGLDHAIISSIAYSSVDDRVFVGLEPFGPETTPAAVFVSTDAGANWVATDGGLAADNDGRLWALDLMLSPEYPSRIFIGSSLGVHRSFDAGITWTQVLNSGGNLTLIRHLAMAPDGSGRLWALGFTGTSESRFYRSVDWGDTWNQLDVPPASDALMAHSDTAGVVLLGGGSRGVVVSRDGGITWDREDLGEVIVKALASMNGLLYAGTGSSGPRELPTMLFRSDGQAVDWEPLQVPEKLKDITTMSAGSDFLFVGTSNSGVWRFRPR